MMKLRMKGSRARQRGSVLLEAVVGIFVLSFGVLAIVGLQAAMNHAQGTAKFRADAANLAAELVGLMWVDQPGLAFYTTDQCKTRSACRQWAAKVASAIPKGETEILNLGSGAVEIKVKWTSAMEGEHVYVLRTNVNF
ncbi:type IV pilus modification PilV family protein [Variovorax paradoxus]|uniref:type IV pilus modification PilV family protein n=1 Tax=Variovorax paradoxus TaxID=34073 RepID=UPI003D659924